MWGVATRALTSSGRTKEEMQPNIPAFSESSAKNVPRKKICTGDEMRVSGTYILTYRHVVEL